MKFDLHIHTNKFDFGHSSVDPIECIKKIEQIGLDGFAITEHDYLWAESDLNELRSKTNLIILNGFEIVTEFGDILIYGLEKEIKRNDFNNIFNLLKYVNENNGCSIIAHPWNKYKLFNHSDFYLMQRLNFVDGIETLNGSTDRDEFNHITIDKTQNISIAKIGGSDAHKIELLGNCFTEFKNNILNISDLVKAIKNRQCEARCF